MQSREEEGPSELGRAGRPFLRTPGGGSLRGEAIGPSDGMRGFRRYDAGAIHAKRSRPGVFAERPDGPAEKQIVSVLKRVITRD
jgi:hypothetical protein